ncbi:MAG: peptidylprolyl isomerase [Thermoguttaceae bacterium]
MTRKTVQLFLASVVLVICCVAIRHYWSAASANADPVDRDSIIAPVDESPAPASRDRSLARRSTSPKSPASDNADTPRRPNSEAGSHGTSVPPIVATVNTERITREDLTQQCLRHYGNEVLESMVNKQLIVGECQRQGITVTSAEVNAEIERMSKRFNIPKDQWLKMLKDERNVTPTQYANDIIWPTLALRKLAGNRLTIANEELQREFETQYGPMVRVRLIAVGTAEKAKKLRAEAVAHASDPAHFGNLAKTYSEDSASASVKGVINPIRMHGSYKEIEDAVFTMNDGDISPVLFVGGQHVILKREGLIPAQKVTLEKVGPRLEEIIRDRKMHGVAKDIFERLQEKAKGQIQWVWNDPAKRRQTPGVAAVVCGTPITLRELGDECLGRHGQPTLEALISRKILSQACRRQNITVSDAEIDAEIAQAAADGLRPKADGSPDVAGWLDMITKKRHISLDVYRNDIVWPMAAMKKLVHGKVDVTKEDLRNGFEANYGARVRCLAIVLDNQRRAQQVFELARKNNSTESFGDLASQYSVEPGSQALRGEIPPIKKHGGQPRLEEEAFALKPGDISGIIQLGDKFVILRCEGFTDPVVKNFADVRDEIYRDIFEKKQRLAMANVFDHLQETAAVDNYLTGTSRSPKASAKKSAASRGAAPIRQVPGV